MVIKGVLSSLVVHLLAFVGFTSWRERQRERTRKKLAAIFGSNYIV